MPETVELSQSCRCYTVHCLRGMATDETDFRFITHSDLRKDAAGHIFAELLDVGRHVGLSDESLYVVLVYISDSQGRPYPLMLKHDETSKSLLSH